MSELLMTSKEAAEFLGISICRIRQLSAKGRRVPDNPCTLVERRVGNRVFVTRDSVQKRFALMRRRQERLRQKELEKDEIFERSTRKQKQAAKEREAVFKAIKAATPNGITAAELEKILGLSQGIINSRIHQMRRHIKEIGMRRPFPDSKRTARVWVVYNWIELT